MLLAVALILDTADGHLARLQGTASEFGRWLDSLLDELSDMALHAAIAWGAYASSGHVAWLALGMLYGMGKYVFVIAQEPAPVAAGAHVEPAEGAGIARRVARLIGHADVRWHLWIVLAALGRLEWALDRLRRVFPRPHGGDGGAEGGAACPLNSRSNAPSRVPLVVPDQRRGREPSPPSSSLATRPTTSPSNT